MSEEQKTLPASFFPALEETVLDFWNQADIFNKTLTKDAPKGDYVFYDGPPFITGLPHYATLLPSIAKDAIPRFWTMNGYRVGRVWGWDCHGLPAENKVEKELGLKNKKDIEVLGVDKFVDACRQYVQSGSEQWEWYINRIGRWVDMKNSYRTMDLKFMESVIWAFKELYAGGFIYEGYRTSLHCPRCATPLSKFEITMDAGSYRDVTEESVIVKFKVKNQPDTYLLAWTTTPWTLPGNLALAVGEKIEYSLVEGNNNQNYVIASAQREKLIETSKILKTFKGLELVGWEYEPLFDLNNEKIKINSQAYKVYAGDFVNIEEGTGIVHVAPNFGEDDFELGKKNSLPAIDLMDENGIYVSGAGEFAGLYYKKAGLAVLAKLGDKLFSTFPVTHSYPFCYRCGTPLIYRAQKAWYLNIQKMKEQLVDSNKKINWIPEIFKAGRFKYNLENAPDWCLSRSRYWGSPIPVWKCACGQIKVVGSLKEIEELSGNKINDLHKPGIDAVRFKCEACGGEMKRVPEVLDCWFESGSMPFAQFHYPFEKKEFATKFLPADFIIEYTGQLRGWFYYLHVLSNALFNSIAFKNVVVTGVLFGTDGRKMSKSYGNYPDPRATIEKYGADALRYYFMASPIMAGDDTSLNEKDIQDAVRKNQMLLWNVYKFYAMYVDKIHPAVKEDTADSLIERGNVLDKWILTRLGQLTKTITENLKHYNLPEASRLIPGFIDDLSTWYLRRSRNRFKSDDDVDKQKALLTTKYVLTELAKLMAPFMPFIAETLWQKVSGYDFKDASQSVHLESWPYSQCGRPSFFSRIFNLHSEDKKQTVLDKMAFARHIVELGLAKRDEAGIKIRQMLAKMTVKGVEKLAPEYLELIADELNVQTIDCVVAATEKIEVELDTRITPELKQEGTRRELVRFINTLRKEASLSLGDRVVVYLAGASKEVKEVAEKMKVEIMRETLSDNLILTADWPKVLIEKEIKIADAKLQLGLKK
ncbi:MAG: isoleucine--tRNA ligase [bacterium]|nr:isoleucine--tRNA ligase [bacterium]